jgi:hypothetical protein
MATTGEVTMQRFAPREASEQLKLALAYQKQGEDDAAQRLGMLALETAYLQGRVAVRLEMAREAA